MTSLYFLGKYNVMLANTIGSMVVLSNSI